MKWQTFGHKRAKEILEKQLDSAVFPHAYLFTGPEGVGKKTLALEFARAVLKTDDLSKHPDFQILDAPGEITVDLALDFIGKLGFKPFFGAKKIAVINNAQNLNPQSGNALLKTLEEPSPSTIIILIAGSARLLPTIVSRCQVFNFNAFTREFLEDFAESEKLSLKPEMLELSFGSPAKLKMLAGDPDLFAAEKQVIARYQKIQNLTLGEKLAAINEFAEFEAPQLAQNFRSWMLWQWVQLKRQPESFGKVRALGEAFLGLQMNKNKKLILQTLFLKI